MIRINDLWNREELLIKNGIHFSDGSGVEMEISYYPVPDIKKGHYFSFLDVYKEDQENMTKIDVFKEIKLSNSFYCCVYQEQELQESLLSTQNELRWLDYRQVAILNGDIIISL
ncbi:hypothetical protein [Listeria monocytogenes]|uniref:hypothetical protein n=1 Tax=Listeria monocytogenes TaxID=1639 RepID=UPI001F2F1773|nr:hypothetical protein [Listeria monocytogenes]